MNEVSNRATPYVEQADLRIPSVLLTIGLLRSLVSFGPKQRSLGEAAKTLETSNFRNTIGGLKRLIGRTFNDPEVHEVEKKFHNATLVDVNGTVGVQVSQ